MFTVAVGQLNLGEERLLAASLVPGGPEEGALPVEPPSASGSALVLCNVPFVSGLNSDWAGDFHIL